MKGHGKHHRPGEEVVPLRLPLLIGALEARFVRNSPSPEYAHKVAPVLSDLPFPVGLTERERECVRIPIPGQSDYEPALTPTRFRVTVGEGNNAGLRVLHRPWSPTWASL